MRSEGLEGVSPRKWAVTTQQNPTAGSAPDLVKHKFEADAPNKLWVADITYVPALEGFLYLGVVLDVWSRRVVGCAMSPSVATQRVLAALGTSVRVRHPTGVVPHSDKGCQSTSVAFGQRCIDASIKPSTGSVGDAYDNAMAECFFSPLETEVIRGRPLPSRSQARSAMFSCIEGSYNPADGTPPSATSPPTSSKRSPSRRPRPACP